MSVETIFFIAVLLFYFIVQASARKKQTGRKHPQRSRLPDPSRFEAPAASEWEEALREIHEKLAQTQAAPQPSRTTRPAPLPATKLETTSSRLESKRPDRSELQRSPAAALAGAAGGTEMGSYAAAPLPSPTPGGSGKARGQGSTAAQEIRELLRKPGTARNSIVLAEVLGPPLSRKPR